MIPPMGNIAVARLPLQNFMPPGGQPFDWCAAIPTPTVVAGLTPVVQFQVKKGYNGYIHRIGNMCDQGGFNDFSGALIWQLFSDYQNGTGPVVPNYNNILASLGTIVAPSSVDGIKILEGQFVTLAVRNIALPVAGLIAARLGGYLYEIGLEQRGLGT